MTPMEVAKFWAKVTVAGPSDCWIWHGRTGNKKYGRFNHTSAHRTAYELLVGPVPEGLLLLHGCDTPLCVNPKHLRPGTHLDNSKDCVERGRIAHGEKNGRTKITTEQAMYIRNNPDRLKGCELAQKFGIAQSTVSYIRSESQRSWKYLKGNHPHW